MKQQSGKTKRWNLIAQELEGLLSKYDCDLNDLVREAGLHPEKVHRLKQSLVLPRFHILNPEELEQASESSAFTGEEQLRLRAAILATAVEETLMNRIDSENALCAPEEIFPILVERRGNSRGLNDRVVLPQPEGRLKIRVKIYHKPRISASSTNRD